MAFVKGKSGNPRGRPKHSVEEKRQREIFKSLLKESTVAALRGVIEIATSENHREKLNACKYLIDRAYGVDRPFLLDGSEVEEPVVIVVKPMIEPMEMYDIEEDEKDEKI